MNPVVVYYTHRSKLYYFSVLSPFRQFWIKVVIFQIWKKPISKFCNFSWNRDTCTMYYIHQTKFTSNSLKKQTHLSFPPWVSSSDPSAPHWDVQSSCQCSYLARESVHRKWSCCGSWGTPSFCPSTDWCTGSRRSESSWETWSERKKDVTNNADWYLGPMQNICGTFQELNVF